MIIKTSETKTIKKILNKIYISPPNSHKGQNGKILVIGGSSLFHAASIWAAEIASYFVDIVHYSSTKENDEIMLSLKKKFLNGIVIPQKELEYYVKEDDAILIGPGMIRMEKGIINNHLLITNFDKLFNIKDEGEYTYCLTKYLIDNYPEKRYVFDAGSLQVMDANWLLKLKTTPIITPHQIEFEKLFKIQISNKSIKEKKLMVQQTAKEYHCVILLKAVIDIVSDGEQTICVKGGNQGLTKGGTGDILAGMSAAFYSKSKCFESAVFASYILKRTSDELFKKTKYWYNINNIIEHIPIAMKNLFDCI